MNYAPRGSCPASRVLLSTLLGIFSLFLSASLLIPADWDRAGAQAALTEARKLRDQLSKVNDPSKQRYLNIVNKYKQVYTKDPHFSGSDDAIYEAGQVYQEMGEKFGTPLYYQEAAKMYRFLVKDYGGSPFCPDALLRLGDLYSGPLEDDTAAQEAYDRLRRDYRHSKAAASLTLKTPRNEKVAPTAATAKEPPQQIPVAAENSSENGSRHATVQNIRHWTTSDYTRIIIDLDTQTRYTKTRIDHPDRIFFDISNAKLGKELSNKTFAVSDEFLKQVRVAQNRADVVRVVLDFETISDYSVFELHDPFRIVVDIHGARGERTKSELATNGDEERKEQRGKSVALPPPVDKQPPKTSSPTARSAATQTAAARDDKSTLKIEEISPSIPKTTEAQPKPVPDTTSKPESPKVSEAKPAAKSRPPASEAPRSPKTADVTSRGDRTMTRVLGLKIGRIVLDPGHGGHDTGTIGRGGLAEKDLVLQVAHDLKRLLEQKIGAEVILTRNDDTFISLEERTAIANQAQADLFVSIHANSSSSRSTSGVETYYLDFARSDSEREVAARENASTVRNVRDLQNLVRKIAQADKSAESRELAAILQKKLYGGARELFPSAKNRGVRSAPFVVLIGANMPSVLAEVAFISNPRDEKLLAKESNRAQLARAMFAGIEGYMKTLGSEVARNRQGGD